MNAPKPELSEAELNKKKINDIIIGILLLVVAFFVGRFLMRTAIDKSAESNEAQFRDQVVGGMQRQQDFIKNTRIPIQPNPSR